MNGAWYVGIDVGGTKIAGGLLRWPEGQRAAGRVIPTGAERGGRAVLDTVLGLARELYDEAVRLGQRASAMGVGMCELVDRDGRLASAASVAWLDLPAHAELSAIAPVVFEADVRAAALAEAQFGAGRPFGTFLYLTIGTGISCALVIAGEPYLGNRGLTGTMASSPLAVPCAECGHVNRSSLEELAAGPGLVARLRARGEYASTGRELLAAAAAGSSSARQVVEAAGEVLGSQVGLLVNTLDPEAVVVGGGLGLSEGPYWEAFVAATRRHIWSSLHRGLPVLQAQTGADAGWIGAAARAALHSPRRAPARLDDPSRPAPLPSGRPAEAAAPAGGGASPTAG